MMSLWAFIGNWLDSTRLDTQGKDRFVELQKQFANAMGGVGWVFLLLMVMLASLGWVWWAGTHPSPARFFVVDPPAGVVATQDDGASQVVAVQATAADQGLAQGNQGQAGQRVHELRTALTPQMSLLRVQSWVSRSLMEAYSFNFRNQADIMASVRDSFRSDTYQLFLSQMQGSLIKDVLDKKMIVSLTPISSVRLVDQAQDGDKRFWKMEMKGLLYYSGAFAKPPAPQQVLFEVIVEETSPAVTPYGVVFAQINMKPMRPGE